MESINSFFASKNAQKCPEGNTETSGQNAQRDRSWCFTSFKMDKTPLEKCADIDKVRWLIWSPEVCPKTKKEHWQCFVYLRDKASRKTLQRIFSGEKFHCDIACGSFDEQLNYIRGPYDKDGKSKPVNPDFQEYGKRPEQGKRKDLDQLRDSIINGEQTVDQICESNPIMYHQYGRTLNKLEEIALRRKFRTEMTKGIWYWGPTGTGKSHKAFENYHPDTHYLCNHRDNGWWDGYAGQHTVIINEFRGNDIYTYDYILELVDKHPVKVNRRGREPLPFISKTVIITSSLHPEDVFWRRNEKDSLEQFKRRFEIIHLANRYEN